MDKEFLMRLVDADMKKYLVDGDTLDKDFTQYLKTIKKTRLKKLFGDSPDKNARYNIEIECDCCHKIIKSNTTREMIELIFNSLYRKQFYCSDCKKEKFKKAKCIDLEKDTFREEFINHALKPGCRTSIKKIIGKTGFEGEIKEIITHMPYDDFLKTAYWRLVRLFKLNISGNKCQMCGSTENLNVHHSTYERHGSEHLYDVVANDLIVLCRDCHKKFHNIPKSDENFLPEGMTQEEWDEI